MLLALQCLCALLLDRWLGEPRQWHPLNGFGWLAQQVESHLYGPLRLPALLRRGLGVVAIIVLIVPLTALAWCLSAIPYVSVVLEMGLLYWAVGAKSLQEHAEAIFGALQDHDMEQAQRQVARIVSRDTQFMTEEDISIAAVESVLENGCDAIFGAVFWFCIAGGAGAVMYRLVNTLDALWGYRTSRYEHFGWAAARFDDLLNWLPARLTALSYTVLGQREVAWRCWQEQGVTWKSPNAGPVMAAGAGALRLQLGGAARYHGQWVQRPTLGEGILPNAHDIPRALNLVHRTTGLWLGALLFGGVLVSGIDGLAGLMDWRD